MTNGEIIRREMLDAESILVHAGSGGKGIVKTDRAGAVYPRQIGALDVVCIRQECEVWPGRLR